MKRRIFTLFLFVFIAAVALLGSAVYRFDDGERKLCSAASVYDMLNSDLIEMYETEIAGESIVSDKSAAQLARTAERLGVSVEKLRAMLLLQDLMAKVGRSASLDELAAMNDMKLLSLVKQCAEEYLSTLPPERQALLERKLKAALKG